MIPLLLLANTALADPFNVWGERTPVGAVSLNPYLLGTSDGWGSATLYGLAGLSKGVDVIVGAGGQLYQEQVTPAPAEAMLRLFPIIDQELALAAHLITTPGEQTTLGPELHLNSWPSDAIGLWVNAGGRFDVEDASFSTFSWTGIELAADVPFVAVELDIEVDEAGELTGYLVPSAGLWIGPQRGTGVSFGLLIPLEMAPAGVGTWVWRTVDLTRKKRTNMSPPT